MTEMMVSYIILSAAGGGLVKGYYKVRWAKWLALLTKCLWQTGECYSDDAFTKIDKEWTAAWARNTTATDPHPTTPPANGPTPLALARRAFVRYGPLLPKV